VPVSLLALYVVLVALATHRVTRFITRDYFPPVKVPRDAFCERWGTYVEDEEGRPLRGDALRVSISGKRTNIVMRSLAYLWECDWCASAWVGAGLTYLTWRWTEVMLWVLTGLAASSVTGLLAAVEARLERDEVRRGG
jgi:hypothetical protein